MSAKYFLHDFNRPVRWHNHVIVGVLVDEVGAWLVDQHGRELRHWTHRHR
jgi:hypothetical protein